MRLTEKENPDAFGVLADILGKRVEELSAAGGGRNSRVYRLKAEGKSYAAKFYHRDKLDGRDRLGTEFAGLTFLWDAGERSVPRPVAADKKNGCAIYELLEGEPIRTGSVRDADIHAAVAFLARLKTLAASREAQKLPPASEAAFSPAALIENIKARRERLSGLKTRGGIHLDMRRFLDERWSPLFDAVCSHSSRVWDEAGWNPGRELPPGARTLSPSDFGFHNAIRRKDESLAFLDFEYFGFDDPAKTVSDFILHPAMALDEASAGRFSAGMFDVFSEQADLPARVSAAYPLYGLKWCLILLNEFVPADVARRGFAAGPGGAAAGLALQLNKSVEMLERVESEYEVFPYHG